MGEKRIGGEPSKSEVLSEKAKTESRIDLRRQTVKQTKNLLTCGVMNV